MIPESDTSTLARISYYGDGVGNCHCSRCNASINKQDSYCRQCGRKIVGYIYPKKSPLDKEE